MNWPQEIESIETVSCPVCDGTGNTPNRFISRVESCWCCEGIGSVHRVKQLPLLQELDHIQ